MIVKNTFITRVSCPSCFTSVGTVACKPVTSTGNITVYAASARTILPIGAKLTSCNFFFQTLSNICVQMYIWFFCNNAKFVMRTKNP